MPRLTNRPYKGWRKSWTYLEARKHLDQAYQEYRENLRDQSNPAKDALAPPPPPASLAQPSQQGLETIPPLSPSPPPRSPSPAFSDALTERIFPDTPLPTSDSSIQSIPPSPRPPSPSLSTSSVEFVEEFPPPPPRYHFFIHPEDSFESLIAKFPRTTQPLPLDAYIIGPDYFDPNKIRNAIAGEPPHAAIPVILHRSPVPYLVPNRKTSYQLPLLDRDRMWSGPELQGLSFLTQNSDRRLHCPLKTGVIAFLQDVDPYSRAIKGLFSVPALVALVQKVYTKAFSVPKMASATVFLVPVQQNSVHEFTELAALGLEAV
ncbi:formin-like protein 14 [Mycetomoellerius zeteki]|uniref:formin-like protein 14 n=1 Tax=Mycetomoellerius zeteki TaxID=64791 RepID=UPI00084E8224|nr:PREDICTED: formin-like protein 14 [Trachymyrmex zeteki]